MPTPAILNPELHFDVIAYTGLGIGTPKTLDASFDIDFAWIKKRSASGENYVWDTVRGGGNTKDLITNRTDAEGYNSAYIAQSFSGGDVIINDAGAGNELNTGTLVAWLWKAGGTAVTNNAGSITSQVSANTKAGFSVVTYTGNATAGATVGHGLGAVPKLIFIKSRSGAYGWYVFHKNANASPASGALILNLTNAFAADNTAFNSTEPTLNVFSLGTGVSGNANTNLHVAYCFAEIEGYSKIGSYVGNGSTDGPFVHCGFKPKFVMWKRADSTGGWFISDGVRQTYNVMGPEVYANDSALESNVARLDFLSNGFKMRAANAGDNASGGTYIFIAFADVAAKYSLGR
jgi:hypothetical protein